MSVLVETEIGPPRAANLAWFRGAKLIQPITRIAHADFITRRDNRAMFSAPDGRVGVFPPPTTSVPEELRFRRRHDRKSVGNTGASTALASHIRAFEALPPDGCSWYPNCDDHSAGFLVHDPGVLHYKMLRIARTGYPQKTAADFPGREAELFALGGFQVIQRGRGRNKTSEDREQDDEVWKAQRAKYEAILEAGKGWSALDPPEDTHVLASGVKFNTSNPVVKQILYEIDKHRLNFDSQKKLAAELGLNYESARKKELEEINMQREFPSTPFTAAQIEDIKAHDGRVVYVHAVTDKPRWYQLDMDRFETYQEAIEEVKRRGKDKALKQSKMWNNERAPKAKLNQALKEVVVRWDEYFRKENIYVLDLRTPMVVAIAEEAWETEAA